MHVDVPLQVGDGRKVVADVCVCVCVSVCPCVCAVSSSVNFDSGREYHRTEATCVLQGGRFFFGLWMWGGSPALLRALNSG